MITRKCSVSLGCGHGYVIMSVQIHKSGTHLKEGEFYCLKILLIHQLFKMPTGLTGKWQRQPLPAPPIWGSNAGSLSVWHLLQWDRCDQPTPHPQIFLNLFPGICFFKNLLSWRFSNIHKIKGHGPQVPLTKHSIS